MKRRINEHIISSQRGSMTSFACAIRKYGGLMCFNHEILHECDSRPDALKKKLI